MEGIFSSGQAYVALSRATSAAGLTITGYNKGLVYSSAAAVKFYREVENRCKRHGEMELERVVCRMKEEEEGGCGMMDGRGGGACSSTGVAAVKGEAGGGATSIHSSSEGAAEVTTSVYDLCHLHPITSNQQ